MKLIAVDIGNSSIKIRVGNCQADDTCLRLRDVRAIQYDIEFLDTPYFWSVCSVNKSNCEELKAWVGRHRPRDFFHVIQPDDVPLRSNVQSREQVGRDRLVAAWAATQLVGIEKEIVVVDAGTAVTIDKIDVAGVFQGGVIFPGADSCLKVLSKATSDLPSLADDSFATEITEIMSAAIGNNTELAILRGVFHSQLSSMIGITEKISNHARVIATGGEIARIREYLPVHWQIEPLLVLSGARDIGRILIENLPTPGQ